MNLFLQCQLGHKMKESDLNNTTPGWGEMGCMRGRILHVSRIARRLKSSLLIDEERESRRSWYMKDAVKGSIQLVNFLVYRMKILAGDSETGNTKRVEETSRGPEQCSMNTPDRRRAKIVALPN